MQNWPKQRAWGWYATLIRTPWFCLKILRFKPYGELSLQRHEMRTEIWFFLSATGFTECIWTRHLYKFWGFWKIPKNNWHKFTATSKPVYVLELQYGRKVTETDIERR